MLVSQTELLRTLRTCVNAESTPEWAVKDLVMYGAAAFPNYARATLSRAPSLQSLKWDSDKARGEEGFVWHELGVSRQAPSPSSNPKP